MQSPGRINSGRNDSGAHHAWSSNSWLKSSAPGAVFLYFFFSTRDHSLRGGRCPLGRELLMRRAPQSLGKFQVTGRLALCAQQWRSASGVSRDAPAVLISFEVYERFKETSRHDCDCSEVFLEFMGVTTTHLPAAAALFVLGTVFSQV